MTDDHDFSTKDFIIVRSKSGWVSARHLDDGTYVFTVAEAAVGDCPAYTSTVQINEEQADRLLKWLMKQSKDKYIRLVETPKGPPKGICPLCNEEIPANGLTATRKSDKKLCHLVCAVKESEKKAPEAPGK